MPQGEFIINVKANGTERFAENTSDIREGFDRTTSAIQEQNKATGLLTTAFKELKSAAEGAAVAAAAAFAKASAKVAGNRAIGGAFATFEKYAPPLGAAGIAIKEVGQIKEADEMLKAADAVGKTSEEFQTLQQIAKATKTEVKDVVDLLKSVENAQISALKGDKGAAQNLITLGAGKLEKQSPLEVLKNITKNRALTKEQKEALAAVTGGNAPAAANADIGGILAGFSGTQISNNQVEGLAEVADTVRTLKANAGVALRTAGGAAAAGGKKAVMGTAAGLLGLAKLGIAGGAQLIGGAAGAIGLTGAKEYLGNVAEDALLDREKLWGNTDDRATTIRLEQRLKTAQAAREREKKDDGKLGDPAKPKPPKEMPEYLHAQFSAMQSDSLTRIGGFAGGMRALGLGQDNIQLKMERHQQKMEEHLNTIKNAVTSDE